LAGTALPGKGGGILSPTSAPAISVLPRRHPALHRRRSRSGEPPRLAPVRKSRHRFADKNMRQLIFCSMSRFRWQRDML